MRVRGEQWLQRAARCDERSQRGAMRSSGMAEEGVIAEHRHIVLD
jgi:hypothetical protein